MNLDVVFLPQNLHPADLADRTVVVFDVLRATTTMAAALAAGVSEIRVFDSVRSAAEAAHAHGQNCILCGEENCLPPPGFDLGNSPGAFVAEQHAHRTVFMSTTNGTRALVAARRAPALFAAALVNASAVARHVATLRRDITLLCAGTNGDVAMEDLLGAGALIAALPAAASATTTAVQFASDRARLALRLFHSTRDHLLEALLDSRGGRNVVAAGLRPDLEFAARLDALQEIPQVFDHPLRILPVRP